MSDEVQYYDEAAAQEAVRDVRKVRREDAAQKGHIDQVCYTKGHELTKAAVKALRYASDACEWHLGVQDELRRALVCAEDAYRLLQIYQEDLFGKE